MFTKGQKFNHIDGTVWEFRKVIKDEERINVRGYNFWIYQDAIMISSTVLSLKRFAEYRDKKILIPA